MGHLRDSGDDGTAGGGGRDGRRPGGQADRRPGLPTRLRALGNSARHGIRRGVDRGSGAPTPNPA